MLTRVFLLAVTPSPWVSCVFIPESNLPVPHNLNAILAINIILISVTLYDEERGRENTISNYVYILTNALLAKYDRGTHANYNPHFCN